MTERILAITGGVGGAKLALGLTHCLGPDEVLFAVNTGDDFTHLGLEIMPDLDTLTYTLSGLANPTLGWGRSDETWHFLDTLAALGGDSWFRLGDRDLALHTLHQQVHHPTHQPGSGDQNPDPEQAAAPIDQRLLVVVDAEGPAGNSKSRHRG